MISLQHTLRLLLLCGSILLLGSVATLSQSTMFPPSPPMPPPSGQGMLPPAAPPCTTCYKGFAFPTHFSFGAHYNVHGLNTRGWATDSLRLDFIQFYSGPASLINYRDSTRWAQVTDYNIPWQVNARWFDSLNQIFYGNANAANLGLVYAAGSIRGITTGAEGAEDYYTTPPGTPLGQVFDYRLLPNTSARIGLDTLLNGGAYGGRFSSGTAPLQIAGNPIYTSEGLARFGEGYDLIGKQADALKYDLTVVMKADSIDKPTLSDNDILLYVKVYRRVPIGQDDTCRCGIYDKVDSFAVTRQLYRDSSYIHAITGYREIAFTTEFPDAARFTRGDELRIQISNNDTIHLPTYDSIVPPGWLTAWAPGDSLQQYTNHGGFFGWASAAPDDSIPGCSRYCARLTDQLVSYGYLSSDHKSMWAVEGSDIIFDVHTTRKVPVTLVRTRIGPRSFTYLRRGLFDQVINSTIDSIFADDTLQRLTYRFGVNDEQNNRKYSTYREAGSRIQRRILYNDSTDKRGLWANPMRFFDAFRIHSGDLDTTDIRIVHMMANQFYSIANSGMAVPVHYANPDSMAIRYGADSGKPSPALYSYWRAHTDSGMARMIAFNNEDHYKEYTDLLQSRLQGAVDMMWDNLNVSRRKFRHIRSESYPVSQVVQVHGYVGKDGNGWLPFWSGFRPPTPEEISAQCWLVLQSCQDGIIFSDFAFDGAGEFGVMHWVGGDHSENYYDSLSPHSPISQTASWKLPRMWSGFKDRFNIIKRFTNYFRDTLQPVYDSIDHDRAIHLSVHRGDGFAAMPLLDTVVTVRAKRDRDSAGHYQDSSVSGVVSTDSLQQTYLEATVYTPRADFSEQDTWFLMVTNRRVWPVDYTSYSSGVGSWGSSNGAGFGARDVRKPVIVLKNATGMISDSFRIQRVGTTTWQTVAVNANVELDWLEPGWGAMYRMKAIPRGVSARGVAYNNSQRVENPSLDTLARPRIAVYERDSIIYMRLNHQDGTWSKEFLVSDSIDALGSSRAFNFNPAVAVVRNGNSAMVVWERRVSGTTGNLLSTVEAHMYCARPESDSLPPSVRLTLSSSDPFPNNIQRTPSVVGADFGYAISWAAPDTGIHVVAIRDTVINSGNASNYISATSTIRVGGLSVQRLGASPITLDSLSLFPTLAYVPNKQSVFFLPYQTRDIYLAWQQGGGNSGVGPFIFFTPIGLRFPTGQIPIVMSSAAVEHVSRGLPGCRFIHPCIAADTLRVGVAFEAVEQMSWKGTFNTPSTHVIVLRFRDSVTPGGQILQRWNTPAYTWSNGFTLYQYPSVVQFPNVPRTILRSEIPGGLAWYAPDGGGDSKVLLYRYRARGIDSSLNGVDPTMVRSPLVYGSTAYSTSGIFYREPDRNRDTALNIAGISAAYYRAHLENTPSVPSALFINTPPQGGAIFANFVLRQTVYDHESCEIPSIIGGLVIRNPIDPGDDGYWIPIGIKFVTGLPPSFFAEPDSGNTVVDTITKISTVVRTGDFHAPSGGVTIQWGIQGSSQLGTWLQNAPNDSLLNIPANIVASLQLVRASNNSVLWTSDTVSALSLMSPDPVGFETDIAADSLAGVDSLVYVRMVVYAPMNLDYTMSTGFQFIEDPVNYFPKRVRRSNGDESLGEAMLSLSVHPNPVNDKMTTVVVTSPFGDNPTTLKLYDITGNLLFDLGTVVLRDGYGSGQLNVSNLKAGVYSLVIQQKERVASTKLTVIR